MILMICAIGARRLGLVDVWIFAALHGVDSGSMWGWHIDCFDWSCGYCNLDQSKQVFTKIFQSRSIARISLPFTPHS